MKLQKEKILILDFGSQYTQLIARRCREEGVFSQIEPWNLPFEKIHKINPIGIILSGGPNSIYDEGAPDRGDDLFSLKIPILGICYGMFNLIKTQGGKIESSAYREYGPAEVSIGHSSVLFEGLSRKEQVWMSHGDHVIDIPDGWETTARSSSGIISATEDIKNNLFGVQFHPEVSHTISGGRILRNFLYRICHAQGGWDMGSFVKNTLSELKETLRDEKVICAFSGGVDSAVAATLVYQAIGENLQCILVDNGLLRKDESEQVETIFSNRFGKSLKVVHDGENFLSELKGIIDPEKKRKIIGNRFIKVFQEEARNFSNEKFLLQGTIYPDVIESADSCGPAAIIKTHHNVGGLPDVLGLELVEPLRNLFKDEVRKVGRELGLPEEIIMRHPFPGPGLAVRILGEVRSEEVKILQETDAIFIEELRKFGWYEKVSQAFAVLLPVKSVGVMGDARTYERVVALRSVDTTDFMTANFSPLPYDLLSKVATRISGEVRGVNRVVYDISSKPPGTIEWE